MKIVLIQGSLNKNSRTSIVANEAVESLKKSNVDVDLIDLRKINLEFCDGRGIEEYNEDMQETYRKIKEADGVIIAMPVYQFSVAGPLKNFLDINSRAFTNKKFGIICNSGGIRSFLASADLMKILSYEVHAVPVQPVVHTWVKDFEDGKLVNEDIKKRIKEMADALISLIK